MKKQKTLIVPKTSPRNHLVTAVKLRGGSGSHRISKKTERQHSARQLQRILKIPADSGDFLMGFIAQYYIQSSPPHERFF